MSEHLLLTQIIILLLGAVVTVAVFQRIGFGAVLGYLVAGVLVGPFGLALVTDTETISILGEFGVVFLLFIIGLELPIDRIRVMRVQIFGLGLVQILSTALVIFWISRLLGIGPVEASIIGIALALSSTAVVLTLLSEQGRLPTRMGRTVFGVLLMQDLAVGPILAVVVTVGAGDGSIMENLGFAIVKMIAAIAIILGLGRWLLVQLFVTIGALRNIEIFAAFTLLVLMSAAAITETGGLSLAFGAFLAGMLLADTPFRHQVAAEIQPFRGLLLGLFFMGVGMGIDVDLVAESSRTIALYLVGLLALKAAVIFTITRISGLSTAEAAESGVYLSQGGEFAFVIFAAALNSGLIASPLVQIISVTVGLSMLVTPAIVRMVALLIERWELASAVSVDDAQEEIEALSDHIVIVGVGRVGLAVASTLQEEGRPYVGLDMDPHAIAAARQQGIQVYFGDATRPEVLYAIGLERARALVIAIDDPKRAVQMTNTVQYILPNLTIYARARDAEHARDLEKAGAASTVPEVIPTAAQLANLAMKG